MPYLIDITLDDSGLPTPTPEIAQERRVAIFDILEENEFSVVKDGASEGPYKLVLGIEENRLVFNISSQEDEAVAQFHFSLSPLRQVIKDYFQIVESYFKAVTTLPPAQIEAIDMGRRGIHNEGSEQLRDRLSGKIETDNQTARRLFTLICALHFRG